MVIVAKLLIVLMVGVVGTHAVAQDVEQCVEGVCFEPQAVIAGKAVPLHRVALFRYYGFKVYVAALYVAPGADPAAAALAAVPKRLVIHYLREFQPKDFQTSGRQVIADNPKNDLAVLESSLGEIDRLYRAVGVGDRYAISYTAKGLELALNGEVLGVVPGEEFQRAYFGIWLSDVSVKRSFTEALLGAKL